MEAASVCRRLPITRMSKAFASRAASRPIFPSPIIASSASRKRSTLFGGIVPMSRSPYPSARGIHTTHSAPGFISFSASVRYQVSYSDRNGANGDTSGFAGVTYNLAAAHTINRHLRHGVSLGRNSDLGIGSNFNDTFSVAYNLGWTFAKALGLNFGVNYSSSTQSGPGFDFVTVPAGTFLPAGTLLPDGSVLAGPVIVGRDIVLPVKRQGASTDTLLFSVGTGMPITRNLSASLGYSHHFSLSNLAGHGYHQNTVTLALNYRF